MKVCRKKMFLRPPMRLEKFQLELLKNARAREFRSEGRLHPGKWQDLKFIVHICQLLMQKAGNS